MIIRSVQQHAYNLFLHKPSAAILESTLTHFCSCSCCAMLIQPLWVSHPFSCFDDDVFSFTLFGHAIPWFLPLKKKHWLKYLMATQVVALGIVLSIYWMLIVGKLLYLYFKLLLEKRVQNKTLIHTRTLKQDMWDFEEGFMNADHWRCLLNIWKNIPVDL